MKYISTELGYRVIYETAEEGGYVAHVPALNGITTEGDTLAEAKIMVRDAITLYLEVLTEKNLPVPGESHSAQVHLERTTTPT